MKKDNGDNKKLEKLADRDQYERDHFEKYKEVLFVNDQKRLEKLNLIIKAGGVKTGTDCCNAALLFQHGADVQSYMLAQKYAKMAIDKGHDHAKWLYAATTDRLLVNQGRKQKFGTQYSTITLYPTNPTKTRHIIKLNPYDKRTSDRTRTKYNVPPIKKAIAQEKILTKQYYPDMVKQKKK